MSTILRPHRYDAVVIRYHNGWDPPHRYEVDRCPCSTIIGADYARRFRCHYQPVMSFMAGNVTLITEPGGEKMIEFPGWYEKLWRPMYWLRARWDGLRFGLDRDRRR